MSKFIVDRLRKKLALAELEILSLAMEIESISPEATDIWSKSDSKKLVQLLTVSKDAHTILKHGLEKVK